MVEYHSAIKKNEIMLCARKWMELEIIVKQNKPNSERQILCAFPHMWNPGITYTNDMNAKRYWGGDNRSGEKVMIIHTRESDI
jgi:hypothetical protein